MLTNQVWSSNKGPPPEYTQLANGLIEHLLERGYFLCCYWCKTNSCGSRVAIDISSTHYIYRDLPGPSIARLYCGSAPLALELTPLWNNHPTQLDPADPNALDTIDRILNSI